MVVLTLGMCSAAAGVGACGLGPFLKNLSTRRAQDRQVAEFCKSQARSRSGASSEGNMAGKRIVAIVNPHGGNGKALDTFHRVLEPMCQAVGVPVTLVQTGYAGHAREIAEAEAAAASSDTIIACLSGDGMLHDVMQGLVDDTQGMRLPVAVMPCGSSNGLAKSLYDSVGPVEAAEAILSGTEHPVSLVSVIQTARDVPGQQGQMRPQYDIMGLSHAITVHANILAEIQLRWMNKLPMGGCFKDLMIAFFEIGLLKTYRVKVQIQAAPLTAEDLATKLYTDPSQARLWQRCDEPPSVPTDWAGWLLTTGGQPEWYETEDDFVFCEIVNIPWLSYDMQLAPGLKPEERYMDLVVSRRHGRCQLLKSFLKVEEGTHFEDSWFERYKVSRAVITPMDGNAFMMSGEFIDGFDATAAKRHVVATCQDGHGRLWY